MATKEDPATARRGENFYSYFLRCVINSVVSSWNIEKNILNKKNIETFSFQNRMLHYFVLEFLFLLVAMTYINALEERKVFDNVRYQLTSRGFTFRQLFIFTGVITFFLSPIADNLTTALVMCSVLLACGQGNAKFLSLGCINIVVAANAGGAYSPFGDITTLMVWQAGIVDFFTFFEIFIPSVINYIIPAFIMYFFIPNEKPKVNSEKVYIKRGGKMIIFLGLYFSRRTSTYFFPNDPVPPVIKIVLLLNIQTSFSYYFFIRALSWRARATKEKNYQPGPW